MNAREPTAFRVEHHHGEGTRVLGIVSDVAAHYRSLDPFLSTVLRTGVAGELRLVDVATGKVVLRRRVAPYRNRPFRESRGSP